MFAEESVLIVIQTRRRFLVFESLELRLAMIAEGSSYSFVEAVLDTSAILGPISAQADWGDGTRTPIAVSSSPPVGPITARFDYSLDTGQFFNTPEKKAILQAAADMVFTRFSDTLAAITPSGNNRWEAVFLDPSTGASVRRSIGNVAANELVIFVGSRNLPGNAIAVAGSGGSSWIGTPAWGQSVVGRGQAGVASNIPTDFGPWGGSLTVDAATNWHFGPTTDGLDRNEYDFLTAVSHEFMHILGFGVAPSWRRIAGSGQLVGQASIRANGGQPVPLDADLAHWREGTQSRGQETLMDPTINNSGIRKLPTPLDLAGIVDVGWNLIPQQIRVSGTHTYADDGFFPVEVILTGGRAGARSTVIGIVEVSNVFPTLNPQGNRTGKVNVPISIVDLGVFQDVGFGPSETFQSSIDWGDSSPVDLSAATIDRPGQEGVATVGSFDGTHTYLQPGNYTVRYRVIDDNGGFAEQTFAIQVDRETINLSLNVAQTREDAGPGAAVLHVSRSDLNTAHALDVLLTTSNSAAATIPASVSIPAGATSIDVSVTVVDDSIVDGVQTVQFTAEATGYFGSIVSLSILDYEPLQWVEQGIALAESPANQSSTITIRLPAPAPVTGSIVNLSADLDGQLQFPAQVVVPAGRTTTVVSVFAINDTFAESPNVVTLSASQAGMNTGTIAITVTDDDRSIWTNSANVLDTDGDGSVSPIDVLNVINYLKRLGSGILPSTRDPLGPPYVDVNGNGIIEPQDVLLVINSINRRSR